MAQTIEDWELELQRNKWGQSKNLFELTLAPFICTPHFTDHWQSS
jgi:hypothetical protein